MKPDTNGVPASSVDASRLSLLYELGCAFAARTDLAELVPLVIAKCRGALRAEGAAVLLVDPETDELYFPYLSQEDAGVAERLAGIRLPPGRGIAGAVLASGRAVRLDEVAHDPHFYEVVDRTTGFTTRCMLAAPLLTRQGAIGVIEVVNRLDGEVFSDADLAFLETLADSIAIAIENARLYAQLRDSEERLRDQVGALRRDLARSHRFTDIVGSSDALEEVFRLMESAASSPISVLIEGETGTGKELVARGIHRASGRAHAAFLAVNCAALPETLLESELFGHRRGAFTGADRDRRGLFEVAQGGTVFLDEIGEMPLAMQAKLLRVLQEGEVVPLGDSRTRRVDVRVISATNRDLENDVRAGRFRDDLYYRLAAFPIHVPPLRERREDIPSLVNHFLRTASSRHGKMVRGVDSEALALLAHFDWPGNVRELQNELERAVALAAPDDVIRISHLSVKLAARADSAPGATTSQRGGAVVASEEAPRASAARRGRVAPRVTAGDTGTLREARSAFEARYIAEVLERHGGNVSSAARALGLSRTMLHKKLRALCGRPTR